MLTLKDFKNIFGNKISLKNDIIDVCLGKVKMMLTLKFRTVSIKNHILSKNTILE